MRAFFVGGDGRLRWGWRLVIFALATIVVLIAGQALAFPFFGIPTSTSGGDLLLQEWLFLLALLGAHAIVLRKVERRGWSWVAMGRRALAPAVLLKGIVIGALAIGVPSGLLLAARWLQVQPGGAGSWAVAAGSLAATLAPAALWEELAFRGYPFAVLRERFGTWVALGVTSVLFGLLHAQNPGAAPLPIFIVMVAGVFLGAVLLLTGSLFAAWAAHFAWNWTMSAVFHMAVSGGGFPTPGYQVVETGPDWLTGGAWGPEGGLGALFGMAAALWYLVGRRGRPAALPVAEHTIARQAGREESSG